MPHQRRRSPRVDPLISPNDTFATLKPIATGAARARVCFNFGNFLMQVAPNRDVTLEQKNQEFMEKPQIVAYLKTYCGWSNGVRAVLKKYDLPYEEKDIIQNPAFRWEMEQKSGQPLSPCLEINGEMLPDVSGEEVEQYLIEKGLVAASNAATDVPLNAPCPPEQHEAPNVVFRR